MSRPRGFPRFLDPGNKPLRYKQEPRKESAEQAKRRFRRACPGRSGQCYQQRIPDDLRLGLAPAESASRSWSR